MFWSLFQDILRLLKNIWDRIFAATYHRSRWQVDSVWVRLIWQHHCEADVLKEKHFWIKFAANLVTVPEKYTGCYNKHSDIIFEQYRHFKNGSTWGQYSRWWCWSLGLGFLWHVIFLSWHLLTCIIKYKHISDSCEHENMVFIGHINGYLNHILALGHIWARSDIKSYFWSYFRRVSLIAQKYICKYWQQCYLELPFLEIFGLV